MDEAIRRTGPPPRPVAATSLLALVMAAAAVALTLGLSPSEVLPRVPLALLPAGVAALLFTVAFALSELALLRVEFRREVYSFSLAGIPLVLGALTLSPGFLVGSRVAGALLIFALQRLSRVKSLFNVCAYGLEAALVTAGLQLWVHPNGVGEVPLSPRGLLVVFAVAAVADLVLSASVLAVISLHSGRLRLREWLRALVPSAGLNGATTVVALAAALLGTQGPAGWTVLGALLPVGLVVYHSCSSLQRRNRSLQLVHDFVAQSQASNDVLWLGRALLTGAQSTFNARWTALYVVESPDAVPQRLVLSEDGSLVGTVGAPPGPVETLAMAATVRTGPVLLRRAGRDPEVQRTLAEAGCRDAMVVPMGEERYPLVTLVIADRVTDSVGFSDEDLAVARTLGGHAITAMRGAMLLERVQHTATHDTLTGLANRALLEIRLAELATTASTRAAVLLLDLNRFKEINDALGHQTGDRVLRVVADRLRRLTPDDALVARLGGDEFAILLPRMSDPEVAQELATAVAAALREPLTLDDIDVSADASIGLAYSGLDPSADATDLMRQADLAMYEAKANAHGVVTYARELERGHAERLALVADLQLALDRGELTIAYQPVMDLKRRTLRRVEALCRWTHPRLGPLRPDLFVALAESTGLIHELTRYVLTTALAQCRRWADEGLDVGVSVNLSARNLSDPTLPQTVATLLDLAGVPAEKLTLEITESSIVADPARATAVLDALSALGITLSLDDFGTGYSSLSYLRTLPVQEVKIDKSFVFALAERSEGNMALVLVESIIELAHRLGLHVTAEGVEDVDTLELLAAAGCDGAQGFHISKPAGVPRVTALLRRHGAATTASPMPGIPAQSGAGSEAVTAG